MSDKKKTNRCKGVSKAVNMEDLLNESGLFEKSAPQKRVPKRQQKAESSEAEEDITNMISMYQANAKKKRCEDTLDVKESRQKVLDVLGQQLEARKGMNMNYVNRLQGLITQVEADYENLTMNEQKLEQLAGAYGKCLKQCALAKKQYLKTLRDIHGMFKKECEEMDAVQKTETGKLAQELEEDMNRLKQQLVSEIKRKEHENLRRKIFHAMQNDF